jgi:succinate dehydrogenase / fumarate reductase cytochrome b subunit
VKKQRPVNLNIFTIRLPVPAIASILHRISGIFLFLAIPAMLWGLHSSLASQQDFDSLHQSFSSPVAKFIIWGLLTSFFYHFVAGIRHLLMDINLGVELKSGRMTAFITIFIAIILSVLTGVWLW